MAFSGNQLKRKNTKEKEQDLDASSDESVDIRPTSAMYTPSSSRVDIKADVLQDKESESVADSKSSGHSPKKGPFFSLHAKHSKSQGRPRSNTNPVPKLEKFNRAEQILLISTSLEDGSAMGSDADSPKHVSAGRSPMLSPKSSKKMVDSPRSDSGSGKWRQKKAAAHHRAETTTLTELKRKNQAVGSKGILPISELEQDATIKHFLSFSKDKLDETAKEAAKKAAKETKEPFSQKIDIAGMYLHAKDEQGKFSLIAIKRPGGEGWVPYLIEFGSMLKDTVENEEAIIGDGAEAKVIPAYDLFSGEKVAVKILKDNCPEEAAKNEQWALTKMGDFIGRIDYLVQHDEQNDLLNEDTLFSMECRKSHSPKQVRKKMFVERFKPGTNLAEFLYKTDPTKKKTDSAYYVAKIDYPPLVRLEVVYQVLLAASVLYDKDLVHRDLKPENIIIDKNFHVELCDFASAKYKTALTGGESIASTYAYTAPEADRSNGDDFILMSIQDGCSVDLKKIVETSQKNKDKPLPVILNNHGFISIYGCINKQWKLTELDVEGSEAFKFLKFPVDNKTAMLRQRNVNAKMRVEITKKKRHIDARGVNFIEQDKYSVGGIAFEIMTTTHLKAKIHAKSLEKKPNEADREMTRAELFALMPDIFPTHANGVYSNGKSPDDPDVLAEAMDKAFERFLESLHPTKSLTLSMVNRFIEDFVYNHFISAEFISTNLSLMALSADERCQFGDAAKEIHALSQKFLEKYKPIKAVFDAKLSIFFSKLPEEPLMRFADKLGKLVKEKEVMDLKKPLSPREMGFFQYSSSSSPQQSPHSTSQSCETSSSSARERMSSSPKKY